MKVYIMRHGDALLPTVDIQRHLSPTGRTQVEQVTRRLQAKGIGPQFIYHSGILRAQETAAVVAQILQVKAVEKIAGLLPKDPVETVLDQLEGWASDVMLISHLPYVSVLLATLSEGCDEVDFEPATIACLEKVKQEWIMQEVIAPETI